MSPEPDDHDVAVPARENAGGSVASGELLRKVRTENGLSLAGLSAIRPVLLIFLRHNGCTFCRQTLADLAQAKARLDTAGVQPVIVHMEPAAEFTSTMKKYQLEGVPQISDPGRRLYQGLGLQHGRAGQLLGWRVWWHGFLAAIVQRHGVGKMCGDVRQMPGLFLIHHGRVVKEFRHSYSSDRPDLLAFVGHQS